jgi:hypothetical protein
MSNSLLYELVAAAALEEIGETDRFTKDSAIERAGLTRHFGKIAAFFSWHSVRQLVEEQLGSKLMPFASDDHDWDPEIHPEKFLPGRGRKTIGYALAKTMPVVAEEYLKRRYAVMVGTHRNVESLVLSFERQGIALTYKPASPPVLQLPHRQAAE